jgi:hypothetical protein
MLRGFASLKGTRLMIHAGPLLDPLPLAPPVPGFPVGRP